MPEFYATIRKQSKYFKSQAQIEKKKQIPFPVRLNFDGDPCWPVSGGPGDRYTLFDIDLYIKRGDVLLQVPMHTPPL